MEWTQIVASDRNGQGIVEGWLLLGLFTCTFHPPLQTHAHSWGRHQQCQSSLSICPTEQRGDSHPRPRGDSQQRKVLGTGGQGIVQLHFIHLSLILVHDRYSIKTIEWSQLTFASAQLTTLHCWEHHYFCFSLNFPICEAGFGNTSLMHDI